MRVSKKWLQATFLNFTGFASRISSRAAKVARYENLWVLIRSDAHAARAGIKLKGRPPLNNPRVYRQAEAAHRPFLLCPDYGLKLFSGLYPVKLLPYLFRGLGGKQRYRYYEYA